MKRRFFQIFKITKYCFKYAPLESSILIVESVLSGLVPYFEIIFIAKFIESIRLLYLGKPVITNSVLYLCGLLFALVQYDIGDIVDDYFCKKIELKLNKNYVPKLVEKTSHIKYELFEDSEHLDLINNVLSAPEEIIVDGYTCLISIVQAIIGLVSVTLAISTIIWWVGLIVLFSSIPLMFISGKEGKHIYSLKKETSKMVRYKNYLEDIAINRENSIERAIFENEDLINDKLAKANDRLYKKTLNLSVKKFFKSKVAGLFSMISSFVIIIFLTINTLTGNLSLALFISCSTGIFSLLNNITGSFSSNLTNIAADCEYIAEEDRFNNLEKYAVVTSSDNNLDIEEIKFVNVSFKYPNSNRYVLKNISFTLTKKSYAIVGKNGAGKTTIIKLIMKLYENYIGDIFINGINLKNLDIGTIRKSISVVFQDFNRHAYSLKENIYIGDLHREFDKECYDKTVSEVKLTDLINRLDNKDETLLGKIYEKGADLSGGQWQRVAIARCLYSSSNLKILDEPTSAIDSSMEKDLYELFNSVSKKYFTVVISHRLASAMNVDEIIVIDEGNVLEFGTPEELLKKGGLFKKMYEEQSKWYV